MIQSNFSVLPFYDSVDQQLHRKSYAYNSVFPLIASSSTLLPFQTSLEGEKNWTLRVDMVSMTPGVSRNITAEIEDAGLKQEYYDGNTIISFPAVWPLATPLAQGQYFLHVVATFNEGGNKFTVWDRFSEVFTVVNSVDRFLKLEWFDIVNLVHENGVHLYDGGYKNKLYIDTQLGKPEYKFEEEGEDRDGFFFPEKQISEKVYKFTFLAPEYLLDALRIVRLSDHVFITDMYGKKYRCDTILMTPKWEAQGNLASVQVEFETNTVVKKLGKGYMPSTQGGDFNNDFNNDFNIE